jgi:RNA polymerase sigma-70 factor (ECF subfamily)
VLQMRYVAELSAPEVAVILGKTEGAVRSLQHRGERALGRLLQDAGGHTEFTRHADRDPGAPSDDRGAS